MIGLEKKLISIVEKIVRHSGNSQTKIVSMDSSFIDELEFDSLNEIEFIMELEFEFDISIPDELAEEMTNSVLILKDILPILREKYGIFDIKKDRKEKIDNIIKQTEQ